MNKGLKIFIGIWLAAIVLVCIVVLTYFSIHDFSTRLPSYSDYIGAILLGISAIVAGILTIQILKRYHIRKTFTAELLICYFSFSTILAILQSVSSVIVFEFKKLDNLFTSGVYMLICPMIVFLALFNLDVFFSTDWSKQKKVRFITIIGTGMAIFCGYIIKDILFSSSKTEVLLFGLLMLIISIIVYLQLTLSANKLAKRFQLEQDMMMYRNFQHLKWSGITLSGGFLLTLVYNFIRPAAYTAYNPVMIVNWVSFIFFLIGYILLYLGFVMPMQKKAD